MRLEYGVHIHRTVGGKSIGNLCVAERTLADGLHYDFRAVFRHRAFAFGFKSVLRAGKLVILYPAMVVVDEALTFADNGLAVHYQRRHLAVLAVEDCLYVGILHADGAFRLFHLQGQLAAALGREFGQRAAFQQRVLLLCHHMTCRSPGSCFFLTYLEVEHHFLACLLCLTQLEGVQFQRYGQRVVGHYATQHHAVGCQCHTVLHGLPAQVETVERQEVVGVLQQYAGLIFLHIHAQEAEMHILIYGLYLLQLRRLVARGGNDAVGAEVTLMGAREVITRVQAVDTFLYFVRLVDGLVHPVPDGAADG